MADFQSRKPEISAYPRVLQIETTSRCSLRCVMCPRKSMTRPAEDMDFKLFRRIIDQSAGRSELAILHLMGDPLLNPDIPLMIRCCRDAGIRTVISTNGVALSEHVSRELYKSGLDVIILSFDGGTQETFEAARCGANFNRTVQTYQAFLALQSEYAHTVRAIIQMIHFKKTENEVQSFIKLWSGTPADVIVKPFTRWQGDQDDINDLTKPSIVQLEHNLCDRAWQWLTVISDGSVIPCCRDYDATIRFGNLREQSVMQIWNSPAFQRFRAQHAAGRSHMPICQRCDYRSLFGESRPARVAGVLLDSYTLLSLMYDSHYLYV